VKVVSAVGARPQFVKLKPMVDALERVGAEHLIIHTGQHYDANMSDVFFSGLGLPDPDVNLAVGSGSQAEQTGEILIRVERVIAEAQPDWVLVYGDTNSTLAAALAAVKIGAPLAHIEAGLRSRNRQMPEEINRVLTDHASDLLFAPTELAMDNLGLEGLGDRSFLVGDVMADLVRGAETFDSGAQMNAAGISRSPGYVVATIHRPSNTDSRGRLKDIVSALAEIDSHVVLVAHPRLKSEANRHGVKLDSESVQVIEPLPYLTMLRLVGKARGLITDSGGLQKEAFLLGIACTTIRTETEWPETLVGGMNVLNHGLHDLGEVTRRALTTPLSAPFGEGNAASRIVNILLKSRNGVSV
jgi:UDP-N-acetylglucosamine 2-epimerase (non-hydrolysing)